MRLLRIYPLFSFVILAYVIASLLMLPLALSKHGLIGIHIADEWEALAAFAPVVAALCVLRATDNSTALRALWASFKHWRIGTIEWSVVVGSPLVFLTIALASVTIVAGSVPSLQVPDESMSELIRYVIDLVIVTSLLQSLGEEPGWRGFLLPQLRRRLNPLTATLVLYPIWLLWHLPMVLSRPEFSLAQFGGFALGILSASIWLTAIYERTRSLLAAIVWHALLNVTRGVALAASTSAFLAYGLSVTVSALIIALMLWRTPHSSE